MGNENRKFDTALFLRALKKARALEEAGQAHGETSKCVRDSVNAAREDGLEHFVRGDRIAANFARSIDIIVKSLATICGVSGDDFALCAVGGYGRQEMAPYSDIDLLFLHKPGADEALRPYLDSILYPLWDAGLKVGHGVHTPKSAVAFCKTDLIGRTAYLDCRRLSGNEQLYHEFDVAFDKMRLRTINAFVAAKLAEQDARQEEAGATRYLVEPDIKEGKGGLRDLHTIRWIYKYVYGAEIGDSADIDRVLGKGEFRALKKAERFLWSVRAQLHALRGRADEKLTFDAQPFVAEKLGYHDRRDMSAAERLMQHYFVTTVDVGRLTRVLCARLEEERAKKQPRMPKLMPRSLTHDEAPGKPNVRLRQGRLDFESAATARRSPRDLFRFFRAYSKAPQFDFHPDALALITQEAHTINADVRKDRVIAELFCASLIEAKAPDAVLRVMSECGLLGKYFPRFAKIKGRIRYGLYRRFSLDEHIFRSIAFLSYLKSGAAEIDHPVCTRIVANTPSLPAMYLSILFYETIWTIPERDHAECEKVIVSALRRIGLSTEEAGIAAWAAAHYRRMLAVIERRNLHQNSTIIKFAEFVGSRERLEFTIVLCVCHLRIVGSVVWNSTLQTQLTELYKGCCIWFEQGEEGLIARQEERNMAAREAILARLQNWRAKELQALTKEVSTDILNELETDIALRLSTLIRAVQNDKTKAGVQVSLQSGEIECIVYCNDRAGLLADIAGVIASAGLGVRAVQVFTTQSGRAIEIFHIQNDNGEPIESKDTAARLHEKIIAVARHAPEKRAKPARRIGDRRSIFSIAPSVRIELDEAPNATLIEADGLDRPGLLSDLARAIAAAGGIIDSAFIATYGERVVDTFYVVDQAGQKITQKKKLDAIERRLFAVLSAGS